MIDPRSLIDDKAELDEGVNRCIRQRLEKRLSRPSHLFIWWKPIQQQIPDPIEQLC